jgi:hypothetical protein
LRYQIHGGRDFILWHAQQLMDENDLRKAGFGQGWFSTARDPGSLELIERHAHFWPAVGLVAGALMQQKTLTGCDVGALVSIAQALVAARD